MIPVHEDKALNKIQYPIVTALSILGIEENALNLIKDM